MKKKQTSTKSFIPHLIVGIFLTLYFSIICFKLIAHPTPFYDWDESIYVEVGREMAQKNSIIPLWQGAAWLEKPPLVPLVYGLIIQYIPASPEISTRIFSLMLAVTALSLIYKWIYDIFKKRTEPILAAVFTTLVVVVTAFNPLFIQKAQTVNTDIWLLIGILGYLLSYPNFWCSFFFLFVGVFSKSLLGFYPALMIIGFEIYKTVIYKNRKKEGLFITLSIIGKQISILVLWYIIMLVMYKNEFITVHFRDHLLRRVTQSVESKFGKRTYYFDLVVEQYGKYALLSLASLGILFYKWFKKHIDDEDLFQSLFLLPYFLFLNLTKTKIPWYVIPAIPQASFLIAYPVTLLQKFKPALIAVCAILMGLLIYKGIYTDKLLTSNYSQYDDYYQMSLYARNRCDKLYVLLDGGSRNTHDTLQKLGLLLSTTEIYGNHPAVVYYFGKKTEFVYSVEAIKKSMTNDTSQDCFAIEKNDVEEIKPSIKLQNSKAFNSVYLYY